MDSNSRGPDHTPESCDIPIAPKPYQPAKDTKALGELGELAFILKSTAEGITASRPFGDRKPYDFLVEGGRRLFRVQVKACFLAQKGRRGFSVGASQHRRRGRAAYTADEIDFLAAYIAQLDTWYVIPVDAIKGRKFVQLYPRGIPRKNAGLYEQYREAWHLLKS